MADGEAITREALFRDVCECWQQTEDAIAALGEHFETQANDGWTVGDVFRHLTAASHIMSSRIRALLATGELPFPGDGGNAVGVAKFASLDYKMLRIELNTAHGVVWMYIQRFSDHDLAQEYSISGNSSTGSVRYVNIPAASTRMMARTVTDLRRSARPVMNLIGDFLSEA